MKKKFVLAISILLMMAMLAGCGSTAPAETPATEAPAIEVSPQFYGWLCGLGRGVRIVSPPEVVEEMGNYVKGIAEMY